MEAFRRDEARFKLFDDVRQKVSTGMQPGIGDSVDFVDFHSDRLPGLEVGERGIRNVVQNLATETNKNQGDLVAIVGQVAAVTFLSAAPWIGDGAIKNDKCTLVVAADRLHGGLTFEEARVVEEEEV